jgi:hypothetical protein
VKEEPVSISAACAAAVLRGTKTILRHVAADPTAACPLGEPGDRLWVREPWLPGDSSSQVRYEGTEPAGVTSSWQPARTMTREASRIILEIEAVRLERLQAIPTADLRDEGALWARPESEDANDIPGFARWWDSLHAREGTRWSDNPWVWVIRFHFLHASSG